MLNLTTCQVFVSRDVRFLEIIFPFKYIETQSPQLLFPPSTTFVDTYPLHSAFVPTIVDRWTLMRISILSHQIRSLHFISRCYPRIRSGSIVPDIKPQRQHTVPVKFKDYIGFPSDLVNHVSLTTSSSYSPMSDPPLHYKQVFQLNEWCEAMNVELAALEANATWELMSLPTHKKTVGCKWLYKIKYLPNGQIDRYKARLVVKGFTQTTNMDYYETFKPVAKMTSFRILLALVPINN